MIQRPNDLDTIVSLSLLQEEIDASSPRASLKTEGFLKPAARVTYSLPPPPIRQPVNAAAGNNRGDDIVGVASTAQKVAALKSYRRAMGLCFTCGEKWGKDHKCAKTVGLHVVEELLQLFQIFEEHEDTTSDDNPPYESAEDLMSLSRQALNGAEAVATIHLQGFIQGQEVLMLIDSGSSSNFISESLPAKLKGAVPLPTPVRVRIADGGSLRGTLHIPDCEWTCQGAVFNADMKVLPLDCYDVILGIEWLHSLGDMYVNWGAKWMCITHMGRAILLRGVNPATDACSSIYVAPLFAMDKLNAWQFIVELCTLKEDSSAPIPPNIPKLDEWFKEREVMTKLLQHHLIRIKQRMKSQADKKRAERQFQIGDKVYLRLQPYIQSFVAPRSNYKLSFRFYGPFEIEDRVGTVAYKLKLPPSNVVHPVFHLSQLKQAIGPDIVVQSQLPTEPPAFQVPEQILAKR